MKWIWLLLGAGVLGAGYYYWKQPPKLPIENNPAGLDAGAPVLETVPTDPGMPMGNGPLGDSAIPRARQESPKQSYGGPSYSGGAEDIPPPPPSGGGDAGFGNSPPPVVNTPTYEEPPMYEQLPPAEYDPNQPTSPPPATYEPPPVDDYVVPPPPELEGGGDSPSEY